MTFLFKSLAILIMLTPNKEKNAMKPQQKENPFLSLIFNVVAPVMILEKLSVRFTPTIALIIALALPVGYGIYDYLKTKNKNWMSIFGIVNILFTGGFALMKLEGIWFAVKEAAFPLIIGIGVLVSAFTSKPLITLFIESTQIFNMNTIQSKLSSLNNEAGYRELLKKSTILFAISFFISSALNYFLAINIFTELGPELTDVQKEIALNEQVSRMTWMGYVVIALPMVLFMFFVIWYFISNLKRLTGLNLEDLMNTPPPKASKNELSNEPSQES